jgi:BASS family bile acid:Na+ symporter
MNTTGVEIFRILVGITVPLAAYAVGLRAPRSGALWLWTQPSLLLRSLLATLIIIPLGTTLFLLAAGIQSPVRGGILIAILAIGIGPIALFKRRTDTRYETGLIVTLLVLSIGFIPAAVAILGRLFHVHIPLRPAQVAEVVFSRALIPLFLGVLSARLAPGFAQRVGRWAGRFVNLATVVLVLFALLIIWRPLIHLGATGWLTCLLVAAGAIAVGHLLGGPESSTRPVLAAFSTTRFPALALLLASVVPNGRAAIPVIIAYVISSALLLKVYQLLLARRARRAPAPARTAALAPDTPVPPAAGPLPSPGAAPVRS